MIYLFSVKCLTLTDIIIWTIFPDTTGVIVTSVNELLLGNVTESKHKVNIIQV